jgi:uncharacterized protein (TIGR02145 family)
MKKLLFPAIIAAMGVALAVAACNANDNAVDVTGLDLDFDAVSVVVGGEAVITAYVSPGNATNQNVQWESSDETIATVDGGVVVGVAPGNAIVTATAEASGQTRTCVVSVTPAPVLVTGIVLSQTTLELVEGTDELITFTLTPEEATDKKVVWESDDTTVALVWEGRVYAKKAGPATITATSRDGGATATCAVTVTPANIPVVGASISKTSMSLIVGETEELSGSTYPSNAGNTNVSWNNDNESVVSFEEGLVTAKSAGKATITITTEEGGFTAKCEITVYDSTADIFGDVSFRTPNLWYAGSQTWSDVVVSTRCSTKNTFDGGTDTAPKIDCRENGSYGVLFSWEAVNQFGDVLCPNGWRVPTAEDFCDLDKILNSAEGCELRATIATMEPYISVWGMEYGGGCSETGWMRNEGINAYYWSQTVDTGGTSNGRYVIGLYSYKDLSVSPISQYSKAYGHHLRCVK